MDECTHLLLVDDDPAAGSRCELVGVTAESAVCYIRHGVNLAENRACQERLACPEEMEVDGVLDDLGKPGIKSRCRNGPSSGTLGHQDDIAGPRLAPGGEVVCNPDCTHATGHAGAKDHVATDPEGGTRDKGYSHRLPDRADPCRVVKDLCDVSVVCHVDVREKEERACTHDVDIPESCPRDVETREEREVGETRVHPVNGADQERGYPALARGYPDSACIVHLVHSDRCRRLPDDPCYLAVSKEITGSP